MLSEFDKQHLMLMKNRILNFQASESDLDALLSITRSIEEILNTFKNLDKKFKESLISEWAELEIISSVMMDEEEDIISTDCKQNISLALENMIHMIDTKLNK